MSGDSFKFLTKSAIALRIKSDAFIDNRSQMDVISSLSVSGIRIHIWYGGLVIKGSPVITIYVPRDLQVMPFYP